MLETYASHRPSGESAGEVSSERDRVQAKERVWTQRQYELNHDD